MKKANYFVNQDPYSCCGCNSCVQICPQQAITMHKDYDGFVYPHIDGTACIDCGLCEKVCPFGNVDHEKNARNKAYAFQLSDRNLLVKSSSGGAFIAVANRIIENGGVVYGASYEGTRVQHIRVKDTKDLCRIMGSKYVQSEIGHTYFQVMNDLKDGLQVFFSGTPCQVAGLKLYLRKTYDNLFTSDLICHGVPSQKIFDYTILHLEQRLRAKFKSYSFRDKKVGGWSITSTSKFVREGNTTSMVYLKYSREMEAYFKAFISGHLMRKSCYKCPFAKLNRLGDVTIGDYWGVETLHPEISNINEGISLIVVNTPNGEKMKDFLSSNNFCMEIDLIEAAKNNKNLMRPTPYVKEREVAYGLAFDNYEEFLKKYSCPPSIEKKNEIKRNLMYLLRSHRRIYNVLKTIKRMVI